jgi:hypothetical protein
MSLQVINPINYPGWDELLLTNEGCSLFHTSGWAKVLHESYGYSPFYFTGIVNNKLTDLIPMMEVKSLLTGKRGVSLPFTDQCEPIVKNQDSFDTLVEQIKKSGIRRDWDYIEWRGGKNFFDSSSPSLSFYTHEIILNTVETELFTRLRNSTKRNIRNAQNQGVEVSLNTTCEAIKIFYKLNCMTRKMHGLPPQPFSFFIKLYENIILEKNGFVALAYYMKKPIAGAVFLHFNKKAIYKYGASNERYLNLRPNNLIMWEAIKYYKKEGYGNFSFGITEMENQGLLQFKRGWGGVESVISYFKYSMKQNAFIEDSFRAKTSYPIFKKIPQPLLNLAGRVLYRHIG